MGDRIETQHPDPNKRGVNIERGKYNAVQAAIVDALRMNGEMNNTDLLKAVEERLGARFDGSVSWYYTTVNLDLEARGLLERVGRSNPKRIRLAK